MAECSDSKLWAYHHIYRLITVDVDDWTVCEDSAANNKRAHIMYAVLHTHSTDHLRKILDSGWDVDEILHMEPNRTRGGSTALHTAINQGWTEGVKMLFDAGASYMVAGEGRPLLLLALHTPDCPVDIIDLLLKHGADPNKKWLGDTPLVEAITISSSSNEIVQLLLENGANPNITVEMYFNTLGNLPWFNQHDMMDTESDDVRPLNAVLAQFGSSASQHFGYGRDVFLQDDDIKRLCNANAELFKTLVTHGADVNWKLHYNWTQPLLHKMVSILHKTPTYVEGLYLEEHLDIFFQHGGNITMKNLNHETALELAVWAWGHSNSVRWMIRHGASVHSTMFIRLERHFVPEYKISQLLFEDTPLILLQAGMRVSQSAYRYLTEMATFMSAWDLFDYSCRDLGIEQKAQNLWNGLVHRDKLENLENNSTKCTFTGSMDTQVDDLGEFSDESLQMYPEFIPKWWQPKDKLRFALDQIRKVLEFLSQPQSLQWYCRRCVRENLVSLHPSVVKNLPVSARLKRYILCHEI